MKLARHVPFLLAMLFGALAAIFAHACAPRGASWWMVTLFAAACAVLVGSLAMRLYRWLLTDSPSPITRRDISCLCGRNVLRGVVAMNETDAARIRALYTLECSGCFEQFKAVPAGGVDRFSLLRDAMYDAGCHAHARVGMSSEPRASARASEQSRDREGAVLPCATAPSAVVSNGGASC